MSLNTFSFFSWHWRWDHHNCLQQQMLWSFLYKSYFFSFLSYEYFFLNLNLRNSLNFLRLTRPWILFSFSIQTGHAFKDRQNPEIVQSSCIYFKLYPDNASSMFAELSRMCSSSDELGAGIPGYCTSCTWLPENPGKHIFPETSPWSFHWFSFHSLPLSFNMFHLFPPTSSDS